MLNANYLLALLHDAYHLPYDRVCMHEFVLEGKWADAPDVHALDIAKRMMDYGLHPPTNYFPLIVHEALMIEPTETESKQTLDSFADILLKIAEEAHTDPGAAARALRTSPRSAAWTKSRPPRSWCCAAALRRWSRHSRVFAWIRNTGIQSWMPVFSFGGELFHNKLMLTTRLNVVERSLQWEDRAEAQEPLGSIRKHRTDESF